MFDDMDEIEMLTRMEKYYGPLSKKLNTYTTNSLDQIETELVQLLQRYKREFNVNTPIPKIRMWLEKNSVKFLFFDKHTGRRVILGQWMQNRIEYHGY